MDNDVKIKVVLFWRENTKDPQTYGFNLDRIKPPIKENVLFCREGPQDEHMYQATVFVNSDSCGQAVDFIEEIFKKVKKAVGIIPNISINPNGLDISKLVACLRDHLLLYEVRAHNSA